MDGHVQKFTYVTIDKFSSKKTASKTKTKTVEKSKETNTKVDKK